MTLPVGYDPARSGCSHPGCGTQKTSTLDGIHGRRCSAHPPRFDPERAVDLAVRGEPDTAASYIRADLEDAS